MEFKIVPAPLPAWDPFCAQHSELLFHRESWLQVLQTGLRRPLIYGTLWEGERLVLGVPMLCMDYRICKMLYSTMPYGTIIGDYRALPCFVAGLYDCLRAQRLHGLYLGGSFPGMPDLSLPGHAPNYQPVHLLTLHGASREEIQKKYKPYTRRAIRRAQRFGVKIEKIAHRGEVEDFYLLYLSAMQRNNAVAKYPKKFMYRIYDALISKGQGDIFFAKYAGKNIAGIMVLYSTHMAHYYFGGSKAEYLKYQPNEMLFHHAITTAIAMQKSIFDFMGSDAGDVHLIRFKQKWGAEPHLTTHYTLVQNAFRCALWRTGWRVLSSSWGTALTRLVQRLGPACHRE